MEKLCWTQCLPLKDQCSMPSSVHNEHGFLAFVVFLPAFSATGTDIQSDIDANQTWLPFENAVLSIQVARLALHHPQVSSSPLVWLTYLLTRTSWVLHLITFGRVSKDLRPHAHAEDEKTSLPQHHTSSEPRVPEVAVIHHAPSQNEELEAWLGLSKSPSTSKKSPRKMREMSIAKLTSGVADGGWLSL
jgi:hypothetical protein